MKIKKQLSPDPSTNPGQDDNDGPITLSATIKEPDDLSDDDADIDLGEQNDSADQDTDGESGGGEAPGKTDALAGKKTVAKKEEFKWNEESLADGLKDLKPGMTLEEVEKLRKEKQAAKATTKDGEGKGKKKEEREGGFAFKLDGQVEDTGDDEENYNWTTLAKDIDPELKVEADTPEAFSAAYKTRLEAAKLQGIEEGKKMTFDVEKLSPEQKKVWDYVSTGKELSTLTTPLKNYDAAIALNDKELVKLRLKADGYNDKTIDVEIDTLEASGKLEHEAAKTRQKLISDRSQLENQLLTQAQAEQQQHAAQRATKREKEVAAFTQAMEGITNFFGGDITPQIRKAVVNEFKSGGIQKQIDADPVLAAQVGIFVKFRDQILPTLKKAAAQEARSGIIKRLHNVPDKNLATGAATGSKGGEEKKGFDAWRDELNKDRG